MVEDINIGLEPGARSEVADGLARLLADTYAVYLKTHGYHWNVRGPYFASLHALFMTQYTETWAAIDEIAERIRALGALAPQGYRRFAELSRISDGDPARSADAMLAELVKDHEALIATAREVRKAAESAGDDVSAAIVDNRVQAHEKHAWMLRSSIG